MIAPADIAEPAAPTLRLKRNEERRILAGHPWVFSNEVADSTPPRALGTGAVARIESYRGQFLGHAYVNPHALICARILSRSASQPIDPALIEQRLRQALALRERLHARPYYRWVFGESDGLPGLVLDRYGEIVVGQIATAGMEALRTMVEEAVRRTVAPATLFWKNDSGARTLEGLPAEAFAAFGETPADLTILEQNLSFLAPLQTGQKTGWFYDQRANRTRLQRFLPAAARVLDVCSYVGAWGLTALASGAASVCCVDSSESALAYARGNAERNGLALRTERADAFAALTALRDSGERFDVVILDPPAFIKRKKDIPRGQAAYRKLNQLAMGVLSDDGLLVSCSCSYHLSGESLLAILQAAARHAGRDVQVLEIGGQSPDHPIHPAIPETRYLKAFFCRIFPEVGYTSPL